MLLIDGVKYEAWTPPNEAEFERVVKEHIPEIFGENSIYLDIKQRLQSDAGTITIPDGCAIVLSKSPQWHIVEMELSSHTRQHYVSQLSGIISGINNPATQKKILGVIHKEISTNNLLKLKVGEAIKPTEVHEFLYNLTSLQPLLIVPIEKYTPILTEVIKTLNYPQDKIKVVEFQTFTREGVGLQVHAHLFEPLYKPAISPPIVSPPPSLILSAPTIGDMETLLKGWHIIYGCIAIPKAEHLFPNAKTILLFDTGKDLVKANFRPGKYLAGFTRWLRDSNAKEGDKVIFKVVEPMKKYHLEIVK